MTFMMTSRDLLPLEDVVPCAPHLLLQPQDVFDELRLGQALGLGELLAL